MLSVPHDVLATCRRCGDPVLTSLDTVTEAEWVVVFTYNLASAGFYSLDGAARGSGRYYVNGCFEIVGAISQNFDSIVHVMYAATQE